jgi:hypothetical protein
MKITLAVLSVNRQKQAFCNYLYSSFSNDEWSNDGGSLIDIDL